MYLVFVLGLWCPPGTLAEPVAIKFATIAPEGTPWMQIMEEMNQVIQQQSKGQVTFRFYPGGVAGDERDVIRKIRINQLQGGAFSGFGLGEVLPEIRVLELPRLFRDAEEADAVAAALFDHFAARFADQGYVLLSLNDAGAVYVFSKAPLRTKEDMARAKIWTWQGDPLPLALFKAYGIAPIPLALPNVLPSLQSGLIDACYGTPLSVLALQWFTKVKYRAALPITHVIGALLVSKQVWQHLTPEQQALVQDTVRRYSAKAAVDMRQHDQKSLTLLQATAGIETVSVSEEEVARMETISAQVRQELTGTLYSQALLDRVVQLRDQHRDDKR
jgi:TRAP-type C4-dicarboxylate transport system substrate-binding protein